MWDKQHPRPTYEYMALDQATITLLTKYGKEGWRLKMVLGDTFILEREVVCNQ